MNISTDTQHLEGEKKGFRFVIYSSFYLFGWLQAQQTKTFSLKLGYCC